MLTPEDQRDFDHCGADSGYGCVCGEMAFFEMLFPYPYEHPISLCPDHANDEIARGAYPVAPIGTAGDP